MKKRNSVKYVMLFGFIGLTIAIGVFLIEEVTAHLDGTYTETRGRESNSLSELVLKQSMILFVGAIDGEQKDLAFEPYDYLDPSFIHERAQMQGDEASAAKKGIRSVSPQAKDAVENTAVEESSDSNVMKTMKTLKTMEVLPKSKEEAK